MLEEFMEEFLAQLGQLRQELMELRAELNLPTLPDEAELPPGWKVRQGPMLSFEPSLLRGPESETMAEDEDATVSYTLLRRLQLQRQ